MARKLTPAQRKERNELSADAALINAVSTFTGIPHMTTQEERFVMLHLKGMTVYAAGTAVGYTPEEAKKAVNKKVIKRALTMMRENTFYEVECTRDKLTQMLFDAHSHSANTTEEVLAIREMAKLHGRYAPVEKQINVDVQGEIRNIRQIERLTDDQLGKIIGNEILLDPDDYEVSDA